LKPRHYIIIACLVIVAGLAGVIGWGHSRPVLYDGKTIRDWAMLVAAPDPQVRDQVHAEFKHLGSNALPVLIEMVQERDPAVRTAAWSIAWHLPRSLRRMTLRSLSWTNALEVRVAAARCLAIVGNQATAAVPALEKGLHDPEVRVRLDVAAALGHVGRESLPALMRALQDKDPEVRHAAAFGLGELGLEAQPAIPLLTQALQDQDQQVRASAAYSLTVIQPRRPRRN